MGQKLTDKQRAFVEHYLANGYNATEAAKSAGYAEKNADVQAGQLLRNTSVREHISRLTLEVSRKYDVTKQAVVNGIAQIAFEGKTERSKLKAFELLGKHLGMFEDTTNINVNLRLQQLKGLPLAEVMKISDRARAFLGEKHGGLSVEPEQTAIDIQAEPTKPESDEA